jgi:hypothetical protein
MELTMLHKKFAAAGIAAILAAAAAGFSPTATQAQQVCAERAGVLKHLDQTHKEAPQALGVTGSGHVIELLVSDSGTWTIIATSPNGISCLVAAGESWENIERVAANKPAA